MSYIFKCDLILKDFHKRLNYAVIVTLNRHKLILTHSHTLKWPQKNFDFLFVTFWHDDPRKKRHTTIHVCLLTPQINWIKIKLVYSIFLFSSIERSSCLWNWFLCCIVFFIKVPLNLIFFSRKEWIYLISIFTKWQFYHKGFSNGYFMCMNNWNGITCT